MECSYDYSKLMGKIRELFAKNYAFASAMNLSTRTLSLKLTGKVGWKQSEIEKACKLLGIPRNEIHIYFFSLKVH